MPSSSAQRLQDVRKLSDILPSGTEGGKEFSRVIDLLLFHQARRNNTVLTLFDDRSGDFQGLDALEKKAKTQYVGYQHKFFPSPLSDRHRSEVIDALKKAASGRDEEQVEIEKWILVTPDDFVESGRRKSGGDVTWFHGLKKRLDLPFEIEHWGHKQIQGLFLESPVLGLYYYPELFIDGIQRKKTIEEIRSRYDRAYRSQYQRIEFVGMSVYKEDSTKGIPMENIYIPLNLVPNSADENNGDVAVLNPIPLLESGTATMILGDPGCGKTTLLKFLGLLGQSESLNKKYGIEPNRSFDKDERLPVFVTLRRFADALKKDDTLCVVEYIRKNIQGDFSIPTVPSEFVEYYLETGKAILLFDGMDELPNPSFKQKIRNRIENLCQTYPGNTIIVSSRIFGYGGAFGFDEKQFAHYRIAKLGMKEIERFIRDWYASRISVKKQRRDHIDSLTSILKNEDHEAIRTLSSNPLLLTIITLVHRIDAVLPDERVVLYEKCTETLLNTWHTWKYHDQDRLHRARVDRLNRQRMQAIAHWMHHEAGRDDKSGQAVVSYKKLHDFLSRFISGERYNPDGFEPEDIAEGFIEFVQDRAGLLIEIGDRQFSFVHLTFQEFLTAERIKTLSEFRGVSQAWTKEIEDHCSDPRWHEVLRLLIARYDSDESQDYLLDKLFDIDAADIVNAQLLGGLLLDGLAAIEERKREVLKRNFLAMALTDNEIMHKPCLNILRHCLKKHPANKEILENQIVELCRDTKNKPHILSFKLTAFALGWEFDRVNSLCAKSGEHDENYLNLFFDTTKKQGFLSENESSFILTTLQYDSLQSSLLNLMSQLMKSMLHPLSLCREGAELFCGLTTLGPGEQLVRPFFDYFFNESLLIDTLSDSSVDLTKFWAIYRARDRARDRDRALALALDRALDRAWDLGWAWDLAWARGQPLDRARARALDRDRDRHPTLVLMKDRDLDQARNRALKKICQNNVDNTFSRDIFWQTFLGQPDVEKTLSYTFQDLFRLSPKLQWRTAIAKGFLPLLPERMVSMKESYWVQVTEAFKTDQVIDEYIYSAAYLLLYDAWLWIFEYYKDPSESLFVTLAELTKPRKEAALQIVHCIRDLAYGDASRESDLVSMVKSDDPTFHEIFVRSCWLPTEEEAKKEAQEAKNKKQ